MVLRDHRIGFVVDEKTAKSILSERYHNLLMCLNWLWRVFGLSPKTNMDSCTRYIFRCDQVTTIGRNLGTQYFALAFPKGFPHTDIISQQILKYNEDGTLFQLKSKWNLIRYKFSHSSSNSTTLKRY